jgi:putative membrane protein
VKLGTVLGGITGVALAAWLLQSYGVERILDLLGQAGWFGIAAVVAFHLVQLVFSAAAWRVIAGPTVPRPGLRDFVALRWIREGVNNLLPVAQIGGEFVASRLLQRRGVPLASAISGSLADFTIEVVTQAAFTLLGLGLLIGSGNGGDVAGYVASGLVMATLAAIGFLGAQWLGLSTLIEKGLMRLGRALGWAGSAQVEGLHKALTECYRAPSRVALATAWHMASWLLGGVEVCLALHFLGHDAGFGPGLVIESLGQALKTAGFAVPGALGVQEGGYVVVCQLFGLTPDVAIALSLMKRLREVALGMPSLIAWHRLEAQRPAHSLPESIS